MRAPTAAVILLLVSTAGLTSASGDGWAPDTFLTLAGPSWRAPGGDLWVTPATSVILDASAAEGIESIYYAVDGGPATAAAPVPTETGGFVVFHMPADAGAHVVAFWSVDRAGDVEAPHQVVLHVDVAGPAVAITDPRPGEATVFDQRVGDVGGLALPQGFVTGVVTVRALAEDAGTRVVSARLFVDGAHHSDDATAPYEFTWWALTALPGEHVLRVEATDALGQVGFAEMRVLNGPAL